MAAPRKTPTLQGSVNIIARASRHPRFMSRDVALLVEMVAEQFGRGQDDIRQRLELTLDRIEAGLPV